MKQCSREQFGEFWASEICENSFRELSEGEDLKQWIVDSSLATIPLVLDEWEVEAPLLATDTDPLPQVQQFFGSLRRGRSKSVGPISVLYSFPNIFRRHRSLNCAGATLLGAFIGQPFGEGNLMGAPVHHVLNVFERGEGEYCIFDVANYGFMSEKCNKEEILPGVSALVLSERFLDYAIFPLFPSKTIASSLLGNLQTVQEVLLGKDFSGFFDRGSILKASGSIAEFLLEYDITPIMDELNGPFFSLGRSEVMQREKERIAELRR